MYNNVNIKWFDRDVLQERGMNWAIKKINASWENNWYFNEKKKKKDKQKKSNKQCKMIIKM